MIPAGTDHVRWGEKRGMINRRENSGPYLPYGGNDHGNGHPSRRPVKLLPSKWLLDAKLAVNRGGNTQDGDN